MKSDDFKVIILGARGVIPQQDSDGYRAWGTLGIGSNSELVAVFSGLRHGHVDPFGRVQWIRSDDSAKTWSAPGNIHEGIIDQRDSGVIQTPAGTWIVTWFSSMRWLGDLLDAKRLAPGLPGTWSREKIELWSRISDKATPEIVKMELGVWACRSVDGGKTWSEPVDTKVNSPHGPTILANKSLLYVGKDLRGSKHCQVSASHDDGKSWDVIAQIPTRPGDDFTMYHEFHAVQATNGWIIAQLRNHNKANEDETLQCESSDEGRTWTVPHSIGVWGYPSHLLRLANGDLLMTYGYRAHPSSVRARRSRDNGRTWSERAVLADGFPSWDMGYPSTVQCPDGMLHTLWYINHENNKPAEMQFASWKILE